MATAKKDTIEVEVLRVEKQEVVVLTLTPDEAQSLLAVAGHLGGRHCKTREHLNGIYRALADKTENKYPMSPFTAPVQLRSEN